MFSLVSCRVNEVSFPDRPLITKGKQIASAAAFSKWQ